MSTFGAIELFCFFALAASFYWWVWTLNDRTLKQMCKSDKSRMIEVAGSGTLFIPHFDPFVKSGSRIFLPGGDGLYHTRAKAARNKGYSDGIASWLERGATIDLIVTRPTQRSHTEWQWLKNTYPTKLHVHMLDPNNYAPEKRRTIEMLDTFHPVILVQSNEGRLTGAMWIEAYHPIGSKYAYNIEFVSPEDASTDPRLQSYVEMYKSLLDEEEYSLETSRELVERSVAA